MSLPRKTENIPAASTRTCSRTDSQNLPHAVGQSGLEHSLWAPPNSQDGEPIKMREETTIFKDLDEDRFDITDHIVHEIQDGQQLGSLPSNNIDAMRVSLGDTRQGTTAARTACAHEVDSVLNNTEKCFQQFNSTLNAGLGSIVIKRSKKQVVGWAPLPKDGPYVIPRTLSQDLPYPILEHLAERRSLNVQSIDRSHLEVAIRPEGVQCESIVGGSETTSKADDFSSDNSCSQCTRNASLQAQLDGLEKENAALRARLKAVEDDKDADFYNHTNTASGRSLMDL